MQDLFMNEGAVISPCQTFRYQLWRIWDDRKPLVMFILLNPSTADANTNDLTVKKCWGFAQRWGFGGFYIGNLFAYRSTDPNALNVHSPSGELIRDVVGPDNQTHLHEMFEKCAVHVCGWGSSTVVLDRWDKVHVDAFPKELWCLGETNDRDPKHPSRLGYALIPERYMLSEHCEPEYRGWGEMLHEVLGKEVV